MKFDDIAYYLYRIEGDLEHSKTPDRENMQHACYIARKYMEMLAQEEFLIVTREEIEHGRKKDV